MFFCDIHIGEEVYASFHKHHKPVCQFCLCSMYFTITCVTNKKFHIRPWVSQPISFVIVRTNIVPSITFFVHGTGKWHEQCPNCAKVWTTQVHYIMYQALHDSCGMHTRYGCATISSARYLHLHVLLTYITFFDQMHVIGTIAPSWLQHVFRILQLLLAVARDYI